MEMDLEGPLRGSPTGLRAVRGQARQYQDAGASIYPAWVQATEKRMGRMNREIGGCAGGIRLRRRGSTAVNQKRSTPYCRETEAEHAEMIDALDASGRLGSSKCKAHRLARSVGPPRADMVHGSVEPAWLLVSRPVVSMSRWSPGLLPRTLVTARGVAHRMHRPGCLPCSKRI